MAVNEGLLERYVGYEDEEAGISEVFLRLKLGLGETVAVLSRPIGDSGSMGWVMCHSLGMEQIHLGRLDVIVARALTAAGFPTLRFAGQGYGDSELGSEVVGLASHVAEAVDAVHFMAAQPGIDRVGVMGAKFGGAVAALVAEKLGLEAMALWEPSVKGSRYMRDLFRRELYAKLTAGEESSGASETALIRESLATRGWADIRGFRLSREAFEDISAMDLLSDLTTFSGSALLIGVSRTQRVDPQVTQLHQHLEKLGARSTLQVAQDPVAPQFGQFRFQTVEGGRGKRDVQLELNEGMARVTMEWASHEFQAARSSLGGP
jgi:pimeloyl-ACP methyl ester carboxylesterase